MELLLWPYGNTAALQGPTALGKGVERSRGAFSLPFANHTQGTVDGCCWGRRLPVLAQPSWLQSNLHLRRVSPPWTTNTPGQEGFCTDCSWTCTWHCRSQSTFNVPKYVSDRGCCRVPGLSKAIRGGFGICAGPGSSRDVPGQPQPCHVLLSTVCL